MSEQWFMKMEDLIKPAIDAVNEGKINFYPKHWSKTYNHWLLNIKDWCISRQLYWGHQIPVWYHKEDKSRMHVSVEGPSDSENWFKILMFLIHGQALGYGQWEYISGQTRTKAWIVLSN